MNKNTHNKKSRLQKNNLICGILQVGKPVKLRSKFAINFFVSIRSRFLYKRKRKEKKRKHHFFVRL